MSASRRLALLELARRHRLLVIEDDYDHEFHYEGRPVLPLMASDDAGVVASVGTLSKVLAPGLRLGFVVNFLSRPVLSGFTSAAALVIAASQLGPLLGVTPDVNRETTLLTTGADTQPAVRCPALSALPFGSSNITMMT